MPFERVWDVGGYVISHLVRTYARTDTRAWEVMQRYTGRENGTIYLTAPCNAGTERIRKYGISGSVVRFASRYIPEDIFRIHRTLEILDKCFKRSLGRFAYAILQGRTSHEEAVRHMAHALNQLTYTGGYRVSAESLDRQIRRTERELADHEFEFNCDQPLWHRKRLWCSLRDYLKSPEFNPLFVEALRGADCPRATGWKKENSGVVSALKILELPGDVWNNADVFRAGLFDPLLENVPKTWDMPRTIRAIHGQLCSKGGTTSFYPEQLDVTFDFVPRMCARAMCRVCPFGGGIDTVCHQVSGRLCPMPLYSCGYEHACNPGRCQFKDNRVRGLCANARISIRS